MARAHQWGEWRVKTSRSVCLLGHDDAFRGTMGTIEREHKLITALVTIYIRLGCGCSEHSVEIGQKCCFKIKN